MRTIYVVTQQQFDGSPWNVGLYLVALGAVVLVVGLVVRRRPLRQVLLACGVWLFFSGLPSSILCLRLRRAFKVVEQEYVQHDFSVAEGVVSHYTTSADRFTDCFDVGNAHFCISPLDEGAGFHQTRARGGFALQDGVGAKIWYHGGTILRIDSELVSRGH